MPRWAVGVQTVYIRRGDLLPDTLASIKDAGFEVNRIAVDGSDDMIGYKREFGFDVTCHSPLIRTYGTWILLLGELYLRYWDRDLFAIFQDDVQFCKGVRQYLEKTIKLHEKKYYNLYNVPQNEYLCPPNHKGFYSSNQLGKGALALVFTREGVVDLLSNQHSIARVQSTIRGWKAVDGGVVTALNNCGYLEMVHNPSLVQHTGLTSSMGNGFRALTQSFRGKEWDCMSLCLRD